MSEPAKKPDAPTPTADAQVNPQRQARDLYIQGKIYRTMALVFSLLGLFAAGVLYYGQTKGDFRNIIDHPFMLLVMLIPFLPGIVLSMKAKKFEKAYLKLMTPEKPAE